MTPRIGDIRIEQIRLDPAEAELAVAIDIEGRGPSTEVRGRWVGPTCAGRSTVDVAYPLRPAGSGYRVVIPEPALWDPASPFLYSGIVELWHDGQRSERCTMEHGLRTASLTAKGWRWNHQPLDVRGVVCEALSDAEAFRLKAQGINLILSSRFDAALGQVAQRCGLLVLGRLHEVRDLATVRGYRTCTLGWLVSPAISQDTSRWQEVFRLTAGGGQRVFLGVEQMGSALPPEIVFQTALEGGCLMLRTRGAGAKLGSVELSVR